MEEKQGIGYCIQLEAHTQATSLKHPSFAHPQSNEEKIPEKRLLPKCYED